MVASFPAPYTPLPQADDRLREHGYVVLSPDATAHVAGCPVEALQAQAPAWDRLRTDGYLKDGGSYRKRRHACFVVEGEAIGQVAHRAHWQPVDYNALHGGMHRWFEPVEPATAAMPAWRGLLTGFGAVCGRRVAVPRWHVEAHQFRIDTTDGIGRPTPEGAHRDGVDFVAVILVGRSAIKGGETRVFEADGPAGQRFTLSEPWSMLLLDDARMIHETTPIQPVSESVPGHRDTLVLTYRAAGFQGD